MKKRVTIANATGNRVMELDYTITYLIENKDGVYEYATNIPNHLLYSQHEYEIGTKFELDPVEKYENLMIALV